MSDHLLKQVSVAMTPSGVIGDGPDLLFKSRFDLSQFASFTHKTVMIVGRHTAQQLFDMGVYPNENRPFVVISESNSVRRIHNLGEAWLFYAKDLSQAIELSETYATAFNLIGWTVIGGKIVYDSLFEAMDAGKVRLNRAYIFKADVDVKVSKPVQLKTDYSSLTNILFRNRMIDPIFFSVKTDTELRVENSGKATFIRGDCETTYVYDKAIYDVEAAYLTKTHIRVSCTNGEYRLLRSEIAGWHEKRGVNVVEVFLKNGVTQELRVESPAQVKWLLAVLLRCI